MWVYFGLGRHFAIGSQGVLQALSTSGTFDNSFLIIYRRVSSTRHKAMKPPSKKVSWSLLVDNMVQDADRVLADPDVRYTVPGGETFE